MQCWSPQGHVLGLDAQVLDTGLDLGGQCHECSRLADTRPLGLLDFVCHFILGCPPASWFLKYLKCLVAITVTITDQQHTNMHRYKYYTSNVLAIRKSIWLIKRLALTILKGYIMRTLATKLNQCKHGKGLVKRCCKYLKPVQPHTFIHHAPCKT